MTLHSRSKIVYKNHSIQLLTNPSPQLLTSSAEDVIVLLPDDKFLPAVSIEIDFAFQTQVLPRVDPAPFV